MAVLSRKNRIYLVKLLALMSIVRWPNVLLTAVAQYLSALTLFSVNKPWYEVLQDGKLHSIVFASACVIAGGFIINSFYDLEKDLVNRPHKTLFDRVVSKAFCLNTYFVLNGLGLLFGLLGSFKIFIFFALFIFGLWFYSHKLQKIPIIRELSASLLSVTGFFAIGLHYNYISGAIVLFALIFMLLLFNRELVKDFRHLQGDLAAGNETMLIFLGDRKSKILHVLMNLLVVVMAFEFCYWYGGKYTLAFFLLLSVSLIISTAFILSNHKKGAVWAHRSYKFVLGLSILYLGFF